MLIVFALAAFLAWQFGEDYYCDYKKDSLQPGQSLPDRCVERQT